MCVRSVYIRTCARWLAKKCIYGLLRRLSSFRMALFIAARAYRYEFSLVREKRIIDA